MAFEEPVVLWEADRSYGDKEEKIQLEQGSYNGRATYTLRQLFKTQDGNWRWARAREDKQGRYWASMSLRDKEFQELAAALLNAASGGRADRLRGQAERAGGKTQPASASKAATKPKRAVTDDFDDEDIPF